MIGKPYPGELHVRFDEGGQNFYLWITFKRAQNWKRQILPRVGLRIVKPVLYSTLTLFYSDVALMVFSASFSTS